MTLDDAVNQLLPYVKKVILLNEAEIMQKIQEWLRTKNALIIFIANKIMPVIWNLITGPLLPLIIKVIIQIAFSISAPYLTPLIPLIDKIIDIIDTKYLTQDEKQKILDILRLMTDQRLLTPDVLVALQIRKGEKDQIISNQEYFQ